MRLAQCKGPRGSYSYATRLTPRFLRLALSAFPVSLTGSCLGNFGASNQGPPS